MNLVSPVIAGCAMIVAEQRIAIAIAIAQLQLVDYAIASMLDRNTYFIFVYIFIKHNVWELFRHVWE